ncbi:hypothetical protein [Granulicella sp. dw_53]|uniref:hypothetical protein n=1 Tax=Granulicella sp. dw_53 TaxID=2719792 RepID=UPI001BD25F63|nr:hypothetical protein [Granulicella sp. dw_53]
MQVVCQPSQSSSDVRCPVCGEGFLLYWERTSRTERHETLGKIQQALSDHHKTEAEGKAHPVAAFNIPSWSGLARFSGAALLGGLPDIAR